MAPGGELELGVVEAPGGEVSAFGYTAANEIYLVRTPLIHDVVAAGLRANTEDVLWQFSYSAGRVATVTAPKPTATAVAQVATLSYGAFPSWATLGESTISLSGVTQPLGFSKKVAFDALWRQRTITGLDGSKEIVEYEGASERVSYTDSVPANAVAPSMRSSTIYETNVPVGGLQRPIKTWGPSPVALFQTNSPNPLATEVNNVPTTDTTYDGGINGLLAAWYDDTAVSGAGMNRTGFGGGI